MELDRMQIILDRLAETEGCRLDQPGTQPGQAGMMYVEFGYVEGPVINDDLIGHYPNAESKYLTCLHELGHFHWGHTQGRPWTEAYEQKSNRELWEYYWDDNEAYFNNGVLYSEAQAWNYALDRCEIPSDEILPETRRFMWETCLGSYFNHARAVGFDTSGQMLYNGDRHHVKFAYGKPNHYFHETKRRIIEGDIKDDKVVKKRNKVYKEPRILEDWHAVIDWANNTRITPTASSSNYVIRYTGTGQ